MLSLAKRTLLALSPVVLLLIVVTPAPAVVTASNITSPANGSIFLWINEPDGPTITISGTATANDGDPVDILCSDKYASRLVKSGVVVNAGAFSTTTDLAGAAGAACTFRAVPSVVGTPSPAFTGPLVLTSYVSGLNDGYEYGVAVPQRKGAFEYGSAPYGIAGSSAIDPTDGPRYSFQFMYRAAAFTSVNHNQTASPVKIDGQNAYVPGAVDESYPGFIDTTYSFAADPTNGNLSLVEHDALLTCPGETYDVGLTSCPALVNSGIRLDRTITQDHEGQQSRVSDKWVNTTGAPHTLTLAYSNGFDDPIDAQFPIGTTVQLATPGQSVVGPFAAPSTTSIAVNGFPDNSPTRARGAITTYPGADSAIFANSSRFFLNYATTIAAGGTYSVDSVYNQAFSGAEVAQLAAAARASLTPIAPPVALQPTFGKATTAKATYSKKTKKITLSTGRSVICPAGGPACAVSGKLTSKVLIAKKKGKKKAKYKTYTIGTLKVTAQPGTTEALSLVLSKSSAKLLLKYRKLKITVPISVNAGAASQSATFTVTAPKIPKKK